MRLLASVVVTIRRIMRKLPMRTANALRLLLLCAGIVAGVGCGRCHQGHYAIEYEAARDYTTTTCYSSGKNQICIPQWHHIDAYCSTTHYCDVRCKAIDQGRQEAHAEHPEFLSRVVIDSRCTAMGEVR